MKFFLSSMRVAAICATLFATQISTASDHFDAPSLTGNGQADINDLYAFQSQEDAGNSVLILTVNPFIGSEGTFSEDILYRFNVDNDGDAMADVVYTANFGAEPATGTTQGITVLRTAGGVTTEIGSGNTGSNISTSNNGTLLAGNFDDPFFFDLDGFRNGFNFTGEDAFAGADVSAIVFEVPSSDLGQNNNVGIWATTVEGGVQLDRAGRPAVNTVLISGDDQKEAFNLATPDGDFATFGDGVNAVIESLSDQANADALTPILLPDVLTFDTEDADGFLNGRQLGDDVIDATLGLLTNGAVSGDGVDANDVPFLSVFPYLATANATAVPEPSALLPTFIVIGGFFARRRRSNRV